MLDGYAFRGVATFFLQRLVDLEEAAVGAVLFILGSSARRGVGSSLYCGRKRSDLDPRRRPIPTGLS